MRNSNETLLDSVSFELRTGELVLLTGENGSGKTALLNVLSGYLPPDRGAVRINLTGRWMDPTFHSPASLARRGIGRLWQDIRLFPSMSVIDNVLVGTPRLVGENPLAALLARPLVLRQEREAQKRALENLTLVGMASRASSSCDMLSVGQMKRVALARLLQREATLMLLDEPFAGLDARASEDLARDLQRLCNERTRTILVVEHRHETISGFADRTLTMVQGRIGEMQ